MNEIKTTDHFGDSESEIRQYNLDHFASMALAGYRAHPANDSLASADGIARYCYGIAEAMMKERDRIIAATK